jgi:hypothetical protein
MTTPPPSSDPHIFWQLRETPFHEMSPAQWQEYYPAMAPWLQNTDAQIRNCAVERLTTAVLWSEFGSRPSADGNSNDAQERLVWLLDEIGQAHGLHNDVIPMFIHALRYQLTDEPIKTPLLEWLDAIERVKPEGVELGLIEGTRLLIARPDTYNVQKMAEWLRMLDHPSDYVRACAAYLLGNDCDEDSEPTYQAALEVIGAKEIVRAGVAGPFWSPRHEHTDEDPSKRISLWMLDLLEKRQGALPENLPFNDITFYLHELCSFSPDLMWRMLRGGHTALALMTATEIGDRVEGVEPFLEELASNADPDISVRARNHLAAHYRKQ